jgi:hypothetical protein
MRLGSEPPSEVGAKPLIDSKLGWQTSEAPVPPALPQPTATRLATRASDARITPSRTWLLLLLILVLAGLASGGVYLAMR